MFGDKHEKELLHSIDKRLAAIEKNEQGCCKEVIALLKKILAGQGQKPGPLKTLTFHIGSPTEK